MNLLASIHCRVFRVFPVICPTPSHLKPSLMQSYHGRLRQLLYEAECKMYELREAQTVATANYLAAEGRVKSLREELTVHLTSHY